MSSSCFYTEKNVSSVSATASLTLTAYLALWQRQARCIVAYMELYCDILSYKETIVTDLIDNRSRPYSLFSSGVWLMSLS